MNIENLLQHSIDRCDYFSDVQAWPLRSTIDPRGWLSNFSSEDDKYYAVKLLNSFLFFSEKHVDKLLFSAFHSISITLKDQQEPVSDIRSSWNSFINNVIITPVQGENPNITDSGYIFVRKSKQILGIPESHSLSNEKALATLINNDRPVVFLDDFVGSGNQFLTTWNRNISINGRSLSFCDFSKSRSFYYCPIICTEYGRRAIENGDKSRNLKGAPEVRILPAHFVNQSYNALSPCSPIWKHDERRLARMFIKQTSISAGIDDLGGDSINDWQGYRKLGLSIAFYHSIPDATLAFMRWDKNGWKPLIRLT